MQLSPNVIFTEIFKVLPLPPADYDPMAGPKIQIDDLFYAGVARILEVHRSCIQGVLRDSKVSDETDTYLPLSDGAVNCFLFATCDFCKEYLIRSHSEISLPASDIRCLIQKSYYIKCPYTSKDCVEFARWSSESGRSLDGLREFADCRGLRDAVGDHNTNSTFKLCKECQDRFVHPISKADAEEHVIQYRQLITLLNASSTSLGRFPLYAPTSVTNSYFRMNYYQVAAFIKRSLENRRSMYEVPKIKRAIPTWLEIDAHPGASSTVRNCELQIVPCEDTQSLSLEDLHLVYESEDESDEMTE